MWILLQSFLISFIAGVPGVDTLHVLTTAPDPIAVYSLVIKVLAAGHIPPDMGVAAQSGVSGIDQP